MNQNSGNSSDDEIGAVLGIYNPLLAFDALDAFDDSSDDEVVSPIPRAPRTNVNRDRIGTAKRLWDDYFAPEPVFHAGIFRRRYRMSKSLFIRICQGIMFFPTQPMPDYIAYFHKKKDCTGKVAFTVFQKCTSAIRQLAYGTAPDAFDEYLHMGEQTQYDCLDNFCKSVFHLFAEEYLRKPNEQDVQRLISTHAEVHGFPGMLGSLDCMHWAWRNCPSAWSGSYKGHKGCPTIMLEAVASYDLWIWHAFFGPAGSNNDINVLNQSDLFSDLLQDVAPPCNFTVNGCTFNKGYYLVDGIYPEWSTLVKSFKSPPNPKASKFKKFQESARKDVERAFGVLQGRWAIIRNPARPFYVNKIRRIMYCCVVLHNMITEDNGRALCPLEENYPTARRPRRSVQERIQKELEMDAEIRDSGYHHLLRDMLIEHIWRLPTNFRVRNVEEAGPSNNADDEDDEEDEDEDTE